MHTVVRSLIAGAAGTSALNLATYLDMAIRARGASTTPQQAVAKLTDLTDVSLGDGEQAENRKEALGSLLGYATGAGAALCYALLAARRRPSRPLGIAALTALAMAGSNVPLTALGTTDPREWPASAWISDAVPHLAYGITAYAAYELLRPSRRPSS
ncbi:hypothetical protein [Nonomuraea gerenzanensis]|uniref:DUF1440 domain-containing protein n=1 Tax=Nonomuraea gerenzanensis TaxID=93944 RepID=A0A1M4E0C2_9ACTN|nr:hypothetical protein [Nonomuraea gerenzanensis]UBU14539.1 hypothetical protein LCN96_05800 [Nonomuraea gerenzanensis]SBO92255.1 hypothetical protein BN4615_P1769 [Nonomuraea gerenzanensis]